MKRIDILTLFPEVIKPYAAASILGRAQKKKLLDVRAHQLRKYATGKHSQVDDTPYGGGPGMLLMVQPIFDALKKLKKRKLKSCVIMTAASGKQFTQADSKRLATEYDQLLFICGRYEGIDARVQEHLADEVFSIGPYVLTGGELPALVMADAVARHIPGVLGKEESLAEESHNEEGSTEYPQYTKPEHFEARTGLFKKETWSVPNVLLSGNHKEIEKWRKYQ
jgi:tRNA (guanine37-N1)-methyltransferase